MSAEVWLESPLQTFPRRGGFFLFEYLVVDGLLALQELESHVGGAEVA